MTPPSPIVGIIANPASGRDLRRLTAHAGLHSSTDKASVVQRLLAAFGATGIRHALLPPDMTGIAAAVLRASQTHQARDGHWPFLGSSTCRCARASRIPAWRRGAWSSAAWR